MPEAPALGALGRYRASGEAPLPEELCLSLALCSRGLHQAAAVFRELCPAARRQKQKMGRTKGNKLQSGFAASSPAAAAPCGCCERGLMALSPNNCDP